MLTSTKILADRKANITFAKDRAMMAQIALESIQHALEIDLPAHADVQKLSEFVRALVSAVDVLVVTDEILQYGAMSPEEKSVE